MNNDNKDKKPQSGNSEVSFPLLFGIIAVIIMAIIAHFMGN